MADESKFDDQQSEVLFVLSATPKLAQGPIQPPVQMVTRSERKHDHSPPSSVEVKNERSCIYVVTARTDITLPFMSFKNISTNVPRYANAKSYLGSLRDVTLFSPYPLTCMTNLVRLTSYLPFSLASQFRLTRF